MIYILKISFTLLNRRNELMISVLIRYTTEDREKSIVYIALNINTYKVKSLYIDISKI